jgi:hypothetical protein
MMAPETIELVCRELVELVTEYFEQTLSAEDRVRFESHLENCPPCTAYLAQMRVTLALARGLDRAAVNDDVEHKLEENLLDLFRRWHQT